jgi:hypothetical protein
MVLEKWRAGAMKHTLACLASAGTRRGQNDPNRFALFGSIKLDEHGAESERDPLSRDYAL